MIYSLILSLMILSNHAEILMNTTDGTWEWKPLPLDGLNIREKQWMTFHVKARIGAFVGLQTYYDSTDDVITAYIGSYGNTLCGIKPIGQPITVEVSCPDLLSENELRPFWVSWEGGLIALGTGSDVGENVTVSFNYPVPIDVRYLAINAYLIHSEWKIDTAEVDKGMYLEFLAVEAFFNPDPRMLTRTEVASSTIHCSSLCLRVVWCRSFSYKTTQQECRMFDSVPQTQDLTQETGWETWGLMS